MECGFGTEKICKKEYVYVLGGFCLSQNGNKEKVTELTLGLGNLVDCNTLWGLIKQALKLDFQGFCLLPPL